MAMSDRHYAWQRSQLQAQRLGAWTFGRRRLTSLPEQPVEKLLEICKTICQRDMQTKSALYVDLLLRLNLLLIFNIELLTSLPSILS